MNVTIVHRTSGATKACEFEGFEDAKVKLRYPMGAGVFRFQLSSGWIEGKLPSWYVADADLETLREMARKEELSFAIFPRVLPVEHEKKRRRPATSDKQGKLF